MNKEFLLALDLLEKEKGIEKEILIEAMENALVTAYKKDYNPIAEVIATVSRETGDAAVYLRKTVVEEVTDVIFSIYAKAKQLNE